MLQIKDMVRPGKKVRFSYFRNNELWYTTDCGFTFPVPISDTAGATFMRDDKAMLFMRYIRKHKKVVASAQKEQNELS